MTITGMLIASLWIIWPFQDRRYETLQGKDYLIHSSPYLPNMFNEALILPAFLALMGAGVVIGLNQFARKKAFMGGQE